MKPWRIVIDLPECKRIVLQDGEVFAQTFLDRIHWENYPMPNEQMENALIDAGIAVQEALRQTSLALSPRTLDAEAPLPF